MRCTTTSASTEVRPHIACTTSATPSRSTALPTARRCHARTRSARATGGARDPNRNPPLFVALGTFELALGGERAAATLSAHLFDFGVCALQLRVAAPRAADFVARGRALDAELPALYDRAEARESSRDVRDAQYGSAGGARRAPRDHNRRADRGRTDACHFAAVSGLR